MINYSKVTIIGGGMMGVSLAYYLSLEGWNDITLIEKGELTSGSTWHAAGQCPHFVGSYNLAKIHAEGIKLYERLEELSGQYVSWHGCSGIRLAVTKDEVDWFKRVKDMSHNIGFDMDLISNNEIKEHHPYLTLDGVLLGAYTHTDGHLDPASACNAIAGMAKKKGVNIVRRTLVTDVKRHKSGEWQVMTDQGEYRCDHVVNAGGCYAREIQAWVGGNVPIANMMHHYVVTDSLPELLDRSKELPVIRDPYSSSYLRQEQKSGLIGIYETKGAKLAWDGNSQDWHSENELFEADYDRIYTWLERAYERIPIFADVGIRRVIHGAIPHTPDANPLLGPAPGLTNFWMCCGSSIGIAQGAGCGKYLAQWMVHGGSDINMAEFDPRRYGEWTDKAYTEAKGIEDYETMYTLLVPGEERPAGRPKRTSPFYKTLVLQGGVHTEAFGWERPKWFAPEGVVEVPSFKRTNSFNHVAAECKAVREAVAVMDLTSFSKFDVKGKNAADLIHRVYANKIPKLGRITLAHRLSRNGRIESESTIARLSDEHFYVISGAAWEDKDYDAFSEAILLNEDVTIENITDDYGVLAVAGPQSRNLLAQLTDADLANESFKWLSAQEIIVNNTHVRALRVNYVGSLGWEIHCPWDQCLDLYQAIWAKGQALGVQNFGSYAMNSLRLEKAYKGMGVELTNEITPVEADIMRFVREDQDYHGAEFVEKAKVKDPDLVIVYCQLMDSDEVDVLGGETLFYDDQAIGVTTSGGYGHTVKKSLFFAYVHPDHNEFSSRFQVRIMGEDYQAKILTDPVYDPQSKELRT